MAKPGVDDTAQFGLGESDLAAKGSTETVLSQPPLRTATSPVWILFGAVLGAALGFWLVYHDVDASVMRAWFILAG